jgi:hypothetical protein
MQKGFFSFFYFVFLQSHLIMMMMMVVVAVVVVEVRSPYWHLFQQESQLRKKTDGIKRTFFKSTYLLL